MHEGPPTTPSNDSNPAERNGLSPEILRERRERLKESFGVSFSAKTKEGVVIPLHEQTRLATEMNLPTVQFDFRNRMLDEIARDSQVLLEYREAHTDESLSFHGDTPQISPESFVVINADKLAFESKLSQALKAESYTVHPPSVNAKQFAEAPREIQENVLRGFLAVFDAAFREAAQREEKFTVAIENMPAKGVEGSWGQTSGELKYLIRAGEARLREQGLDTPALNRPFGVTLDVNHALHGTEASQHRSSLEAWFKELGDHIRVIHLYAPSSSTGELAEKYNIILELAAQYSPVAKIFLESKQDEAATRRAFAAAATADNPDRDASGGR